MKKPYDCKANMCHRDDCHWCYPPVGRRGNFKIGCPCTACKKRKQAMKEDMP